MSDLSESYRKVQYDLRPAKQIERRMLLDAFQRLIAAGFPIPDYQYTGMGSLYFVDFILLHKYLGIERMLNVEASDKIRNRVNFNSPFASIENRIATIGSVIPELSADLRHLIWLDYDDVMKDDYLKDLAAAVSLLPVMSLILITVDAEMPGDSPLESKTHFYRVASKYLPNDLPPNMFGAAETSRRCAQIFGNVIQSAILSRPGLSFEVLWNFEYADGHRMLTAGGMLCDADAKRRIAGSSVINQEYYRGNLQADPYVIRVPRVTRKERAYLDSKMPCEAGWQPDEFELEPDVVEAYRSVYRFLPMYGELLI